MTRYNMTVVTVAMKRIVLLPNATGNEASPVSQVTKAMVRSKSATKRNWRGSEDQNLSGLGLGRIFVAIVVVVWWLS